MVVSMWAHLDEELVATWGGKIVVMEAMLRLGRSACGMLSTTQAGVAKSVEYGQPRCFVGFGRCHQEEHRSWSDAPA